MFASIIFHFGYLFLHLSHPLHFIKFLFLIHDAIAFTGDNDPWVGGKDSRIPELCKGKNLPYYLIPGGNHSLETNEPMKDLIQLVRIMETVEKYISAELQSGNDP